MLHFDGNSNKKIGRPSKPKEGQPDTRQKIIGMITEARERWHISKGLAFTTSILSR